MSTVTHFDSTGKVSDLAGDRPPTRRKAVRGDKPRLQAGVRYFWAAERPTNDVEQLAVGVRDGVGDCHRLPRPDARSWSLTVGHFAGLKKRVIRLSVAAAPLVLSVVRGEASPAVLADWLEENPQAVLAVEAKCSVWRQTEYRFGRGVGRAVEEEVPEADEVAVAAVLRAMWGGWATSEEMS